MNQVNITGMIANELIFREEAGGIPHTVLSLRRRHKTRAGELRKETYRVSAWHGIAQWARDNIAVGQIVTIHGYLTQRKTKDGAIATEICAEEIVPSVQVAFMPWRTVDNDVASVNSDDDDPTQVIPSVAAENTSIMDAINTDDALKPCLGKAPDHGDASETLALPDDGNAPAA